jgi:hypothetical protein
MANGREIKNRKVKSRIRLRATDIIIHAIRWLI